MWKKLAGKRFQICKKSSCNFGQRRKPDRTSLCPKLERQYRFNVKLNDYWTNLYKN